jgi:hypothetical protein
MKVKLKSEQESKHYLFCCCLFGNNPLVSPMLALWGGGDPGKITTGNRSLVGLGV